MIEFDEVVIAVLIVSIIISFPMASSLGFGNVNFVSNRMSKKHQDDSRSVGFTWVLVQAISSFVLATLCVLIYGLLFGGDWAAIAIRATVFWFAQMAVIASITYVVATHMHDVSKDPRYATYLVYLGTCTIMTCAELLMVCDQLLRQK